MSAPHVAVIGAGLAGLAAAWKLREQGFAVTLLERDPAPGGRARRLAAEGFDFDAGAQVVDPEARALSALARGAGAGDALLPLRPAAQARAAEGRIQPLPAWRSSEAQGLLERLRLARLERVEGRFRGLLARASSERAERLDDRSAAELARLYLPRAALGGWLAPLAASWGLGDPAAASRVALMRLHAAGALGAALPRAGLGALAERLAAALGARLGAAAASVEPAGAAVLVRLAGGEALEADAALLAVPARAALDLAAPLLTPSERDVLGAARSAPAVVLHAGLARVLGPTPLRVGCAAGEAGPAAALLYRPGAPGDGIPAGRAAVSLVASAEWSATHLGAPDDAIEKELLAALERLFPAARGAVACTRVERFPEAFPLFPVGRYRELARFRRVQADRRALGRRLYFAGDHLAGPTAEDAARSALRATSDLAADFSKGSGIGL
jgi:protoporphyrinogen oxidase